MKLFLAGYMGSGKTTVGSRMSEILKLPFIDLDDQIALIEEQSVPDIFKNRGELYFRKRETQVLEDVLNVKKPLIVSLGGGTPCYGSNLELIKKYPDSKVIYLKASVDFLTDRLFSEKETRPVINHLKLKEDLDDFIRKHLFERSFYYNQADLIINIEGKTPETIVAAIVEKLN